MTKIIQGLHRIDIGADAFFPNKVHVLISLVHACDWHIKGQLFLQLTKALQIGPNFFKTYPFLLFSTKIKALKVDLWKKSRFSPSLTLQPSDVHLWFAEYVCSWCFNPSSKYYVLYWSFHKMTCLLWPWIVFAKRCPTSSYKSSFNPINVVFQPRWHSTPLVRRHYWAYIY